MKTLLWAPKVPWAVGAMPTGPNRQVGSAECGWDCREPAMKRVDFFEGVWGEPVVENATKDRILL